MRLMQSKAGMFLRVLGFAALIGVSFEFVERGIPFLEDLHSNVNEYRHKMDEIYRKKEAATAEMESLYLTSNAKDVEIEQKIEGLNRSIENLDVEFEKLLVEYEGALSQKRSPWLYLLLFLVALTLAFFVSVEWMSFVLFIFSMFLCGIILGYFGLDDAWLIGICLLVGACLLWLLYNKKHKCISCENADAEKTGFFYTKFFYLMFYVGVIFVAFVIGERGHVWVNGMVRNKMAPMLIGPQEIKEFPGKKMADLSDRLSEMKKRKRAIVKSGKIKKELQQELLELDQQITSSSKEYQELHDGYYFTPRSSWSFDDHFLAYCVNMIVAFLCLILALFIPIQFLQYVLIFIGFFIIWHLRPMLAVAGFDVMLILYILAVLLLFKRQKHICGSL